MDSITEHERAYRTPPVVDPLLMRRCIGHETKQRVGHMQNDSRHKSQGFDYAQKAAYRDGGDY